MNGKLKINNLNNIAIVLFLSTSAIAYTFVFANISANYTTICYLLNAVALGLSILHSFKNRHYIEKKSFLLVIYVFLVVSTSIYFAGSDYNLFKFINVVLIGAFLITKKFDIEKVLRYLTIFSIILVLFYNNWFEIYYADMNQANMGMMYVVVNYVIAAIVHFIFYRKQATKTTWIGYLSSLIMLFGILTVANRGVYLLIILTIVFCMLNSNNNKQRETPRKKKFLLIMIVIIAFIIYANFNLIFTSIYSLMDQYLNTLPSFIVKMNRFIMSGDISNGRNDPILIAFNLIQENPLIGIGIENFGRYFSVNYPHNFILQLWVEGGILFVIPALLSFLYLVRSVLWTKTNNMNLLISCIFMLSLMVRFLLSLDIWTFPEFWISVFFTVARLREIKLLRRNVKI